MNYRRLGKSGLKVSELSFGAWVTFSTQHSDSTALECMTAAYDGGMNFFDNAEAYAEGQAEIQMGRALKKAGWRRSTYLVSTKIFWGGPTPNEKGLSYKHVVEGVNAALQRLQLEYVDLAFCHRPDPDTPIEETVRAWDLLVRQGKVFYWGTSSWAAADIRAAYAFAKENGMAPPSMEQPQYSMLFREKVEQEFAPLYAELGLGTTVWSPLASGVLTGKYDQGVPDRSRLALPNYKWLRDKALNPSALAAVKALEPVARDLGCSRAQLALAWCLANRNVSTVITGASRAEQVRENLKAVEVAPKLTADVMGRIESILKNRP